MSISIFNRRITSLGIGTALMLATVTGASAGAGTILSNGTGGGLWSDTSTWALGAVPLSSETASVVGGDTVSIENNVNITYLDINSGGVVEHTAGILYFEDAGSINNNGTFGANDDRVEAKGVFGVSGSVGFYELVLSDTTALGASTSVGQLLQMNSTANLVGNSPTYNAGAQLRYAGIPSTVGLEWINGASFGLGVPEEVTINAGISVDASGKTDLFVPDEFTLDGFFTAPTNTFTVGEDALMSGGTYTHNGGTFQLAGISASLEVGFGSSFNNVNYLSGSDGRIYDPFNVATVAGAVSVSGNFVQTLDALGLGIVYYPLLGASLNVTTLPVTGELELSALTGTPLGILDPEFNQGHHYAFGVHPPGIHGDLTLQHNISPDTNAYIARIIGPGGYAPGRDSSTATTVTVNGITEFVDLYAVTEGFVTPVELSIFAAE